MLKITNIKIKSIKGDPELIANSAMWLPAVTRILEDKFLPLLEKG